MNDEWKIIQEEALRGVEDFRAICIAIQSLSRELASICTFYVPGENGTKIPISEQDAFLYQFRKYLDQAKKAFLIDLGRKGGSFVPDTIEGYLQHLQSDDERTKCLNYVRLCAWRNLKGPILEVLVLLSTLIRLHPLKQVVLRNVFAPDVSIPVNEDGKSRFVWCRPNVTGSKSGMQARPDIVIATSNKKVDSVTIVNVVECKCRSLLDAQDIRREFGKAFDMDVRSYTVLSYYETPQRLKDAAKKLGIDLIDFGLSTSLRQDYLTGQRNLGYDLAETLESVRRSEWFIRTIEHSAVIAAGKEQ